MDIKVDKKKRIQDGILSISPFLLFILVMLFFSPGNNVWNWYFIINKIIASIFLLVFCWILYKNEINGYAFLVYLLLLLFYSSSFLINAKVGYGLWVESFGFIKPHELKLSNDFIMGIFPNINMIFVFFFLVILFGVLYWGFNVSKSKLIITLAVYFYVYSYFFFLQYQTYILPQEKYFIAFKHFVIFQSVAIILFIFPFIVLDSALKKAVFTIASVFMSFISINVLTLNDFKSIFSIEGVHMIKNYFFYFGVCSSVAHILLLAFTLRFFTQIRKRLS